MTPQFLTILLGIYMLLSLILAIGYLSRRRLTFGEWVFWSLITLTFPVIGPFFVIAARPGPRHLRQRKNIPPHNNQRNNP